MIDRTKLKQLDKTSPLYPAEWKELSNAPEYIEYTGDASLLSTSKLTVVGSRTTPANALKAGEQAVKILAGHFTIVTGVADGGDSAAIEGALKGGKVICVLAGGFSALPQSNLPLLRRVAKNGLLLSPYPFETPIRNFSYSHRNKLLSALGKGTFVIGASTKSGALQTAENAFKENKPVFAFPYAPATADGAGCNALIKKGAYLVENAEDILQKFDIHQTTETANVALSAEEKKLLRILKALGEGHVGELAQKAGTPVFKTMATLSALTVKGCVVPLGGNRYAPV